MSSMPTAPASSRTITLRASNVSCNRINEQALESRRLKALIAELFGGGSGWGAAEHALAPGFFDPTGDLGKGRALARSGQPANTGNAVPTLQNEFDRAPLVLTKTAEGMNWRLIGVSESLPSLTMRIKANSLLRIPSWRFPCLRE